MRGWSRKDGGKYVSVGCMSRVRKRGSEGVRSNGKENDIPIEAKRGVVSFPELGG